MEIKRVQIENLTFDCRVIGNENDQLALFLHGFPETSFMWIELMKEVANKGFYCVAPNLRGYSKNAIPRGKKNYSIDKLANDVLQIAEQLGKKVFHLVGHDWGAVIGWYITHERPDKIFSWSALSVPHNSAFAKAIRTDPDQVKKSQYIKRFQIPFLPEMRIRKNDFKLFRKLWKYNSPEAIEDYLSVFKNRRSLTAALNYYRANYRLFLNSSLGGGDITVPTLFIWGANDIAIGNTSVENSHDYAKGYYKFVKLDAGHWLIQTKYQEIRNEILEHLLKFKK